VNVEFYDFARKLAEESGAVIRRYFLAGNLGVETKEDKSLVTQADRQAEARMREMIQKEFPSHGIIGEEFGRHNDTAEFVWVLDPIDGTISFASGCPLFGTLIGLLHKGQPVLGVISQPILNLLCVGDNQKTTLNGRPVRMRETDRLAEATVLTTDVDLVGKHQRQAGFEKLVREGRVFRTWGDCYGYLLLAAGCADVMADPIMNPWDILPLIPVIRGANGVITSWEGSAAAEANSCVAANKELHPRVIEMLNS
jgi:myo-inositol-1(or 4)-monophosphatase